MFGMKLNTAGGLVLAFCMSLKVQAHIALWDEAMYGYVPSTMTLPIKLMVDGTHQMSISMSPSCHSKNSHSINGGSTTTLIDLLPLGK